MTGASRWFRSPSVLLAVGAFLVALAAEIGIGRARGSPSDFALFVGHFHPLVVHLPIGVFVLVGAAEVVTLFPRYRARIDPALGLALPALLVVTVTAFVLGHLLARGGGFAVHALATHHQLEFLAVIGACVTTVVWAHHAAEGTSQSRVAYRVALFTTLGLLSIGAHFGGTVTHGATYLTEYAPGPFKSLLGGSAERAPASSGSAKAPKAPSAEPLVYADVVAPILKKYCVACHGPKKSKAKLRLDSLEGIMKGGEDGPAIVLGSSASSDLMKRLRLPLDDDDRMPPESKPGPKPEEQAIIAFFIDRGASATLRVRDTLAPVEGRKLLEAALGKKPVVPGRVSDVETAPDASPEAKESPSESASAPPSASAPKAAPAPDAESAKEPASAPEEKKGPAPASPAAPETSVPPSSPSARAILAEKCEKCHGPKKKKGGLRLDSVDALLAGGEDGPVVVAGDPERSELVRRVRLPSSQKEHMPPKKEPQLSEGEVAALMAWVRTLSRSGRALPASVAGNAPAPKRDEPGATSDGEAATAHEPAPASSAPEAPASAAPPTSTGVVSAPPAAAPPASVTDAELVARLPPRLVLYEDAVAPLLSKRCGKCHTGKKPSAHLRIDDYDALLEGGLSGPGIVPGKPDESLVVHRVSLPATDDDHMPPEDEPPMTRDEVALVGEWVRRGAGRKLEIASRDLPPPALRAAAVYAHAASGEPIHAEAGCAACAVGAGRRAPRGALGAVGLALGALALRRRRAQKARFGRAG